MKKYFNISILFTILVLSIAPSFAQENEEEFESFKNWNPPKNYIIDTRFDNMGYWMRLAELGFIPYSPENTSLVTTYTGNEIFSHSVKKKESTDIPVITGNNTQSENSIIVDPLNSLSIINSNNSTSWSGSIVGTLYGANYLYSTNSGSVWGGTANGAGVSNSGDPTTGIDRNGRYYIGFINNSSGQSVSYSTNHGTNWTAVVAASCGGSDLLDKNHMWVDVSAGSPYVNNIYNAWCPLGGSHPHLNNIEFGRSTNGGVSWSAPISISSAIAAGSHNQGVNICTGPNGQVYAFWAVYDSWPSFEATYGFAKSVDGGATFSTATRFLTGCKGIRDQSAPYFVHGMRTNSFPSSCCDISSCSNSGTIYMVWANQGVPGINTGNDIDIYLVKSTNQGTNWSSPIRVTNDPLNNGKKAWLPWITCDPANGNLSVVFYDDRNCTGNQAETWVANSFDGGLTWENFKVSDVAFTITPIAGLAGGYMGDYLGITALNGNVYPCWSDLRTSPQRTYVSPYTIGPEITIFADSDTICSGDSLRFSASLNAKYSIANLIYQWKIDGNNVGTNDSIFSTNSLLNGQVVSCVLSVCGNADVTSNTITVIVKDTPPKPTISQNMAVLTSSAAQGNQWYLNGEIIPGAIEQSYTCTENGYYKVIVTLGNNCPSPESDSVSIHMGVNETLNYHGLTINPNPSNGIFMIAFNSIEFDNYNIKIIDNLGKLVYEKSITDVKGKYSNQIDLSGIGKGIYTIILTNHKIDSSMKIVIK